VLREVAAKFAATDAEVAHLVERAVHVICEDPTLLDGPDIEKALALVVRKIAQDDLPHVNGSKSASPSP
jgi:hypothetical protein